MPTRPRTPHHRPWRARRRGAGRGVGLAGDTTTEIRGPFQTFPVDADGNPGTLGIEVYIGPGMDPLADPGTYTWVRISPWVLYEDKIRIKRGLEDEQSTYSPSTCHLTLKNYAIPDVPADVAAYNIDALFTERNPYGPWFGLLGPNTPLRVDVNIGLGDVRRYTGFVTAWPPASDRSGNFKYVQIEAAGITRRLGQGDEPISSVATNYIRALARSAAQSRKVAWWSLEDSAGTMSPGSNLADGQAMTVSIGTVEFAAATPPVGILRAPNVSLGRMDGVVVTPDPTDFALNYQQWMIGCYFQATGTCTIMSWDHEDGSNYALSVESGQLILRNSGGTAVAASGYVPTVDYADGEWHVAHAYAAVYSFAPTTDTFANVAGDILGGQFDVGSVVVAGVPVSPIVEVHVNPNVDATLTSVSEIAIGGRAPQLASSFTNSVSVMNGQPGNRTSVNWAAIMDSAGLATSVNVFFLNDVLQMGTYPTGTLRQTLDECVAAERGWMVERLTGQLGFDDHYWRTNRVATIHLNNGDGYRQLTSFDPVPDDLLIRNTATVSKLAGATRVHTVTEGRRGTDAVGPYPASATLNIYLDGDAAQHASAITAAGTVDEERYPRIAFELGRPINASVAVEWLTDGGQAIRGNDPLGRRMIISNPSPDLPPGTIDLSIIGYVEVFDQYIYRVEAVCVPSSPFSVFRAEDEHDDVNEFLGYAEPDTCVLAEDLDTTELEVDITSTPLWSTDASDWTTGPVVTVDGEDMRVYGVSGAANPQTLTVTRSANGIVLSHSAGAELRFKNPGNAGL